ncbi:MAG: ion transporter, partial [Planctomycetota bacterium]
MENGTIRDRVRFYLVDCRTPLGKGIDIALLTLNALTCVAYAVDTYVPEGAPAKGILYGVEWTFVVVFAVEYVLRFWVADRKLRHALHPYSIIDLVSILPVFSAVLDLRFLRVARVFRVLRFLRFLEDERFFFGVITPLRLRV